MIFDYSIRDDTKKWEGTCRASSDAQAKDRARVDYIYTVWACILLIVSFASAKMRQTYCQ